MTKAFGRGSYRRLLNRIESYGIGLTILLLFSSYLSSRIQVVQLNGILSEPMLMATVVIQSIVFDPLLFLLYVNGFHFPFANEIKIVYPLCFEALNSTKISKLQDLSSFRSWAEDWMVELSAEKTASWGISALYSQWNSSLVTNSSPLTLKFTNLAQIILTP